MSPPLNDEPSTKPASPIGMDVRRQRPRGGARRRIVAVVVIGWAGLLATWALAHLRIAVPTVDASSLWIDQVSRGPLLRAVQGQGTLVPTEVHWVTAATAARVDRVRVLPGTVIQPDTVLIDLVNPETELQALEADRQLSQAEAELSNLEASVTNQRLAQQSTVATLDSDQQDAQQRAAADEALAQQGFLSKLETAASRNKAASLEGRKMFEKKRLAALTRGTSAQVSAQRQQIERLRSIAEFRRRAVDALHVRAGAAGVVQELSLQAGQSVAVGAVLAKVTQPDKLAAELRISATQAKDVQLGLKATIDTRNGVVTGKVARIDPAAVSGTVKVDVELAGALPVGARPDLSIEGTIELERLDNVLYVARPASAQPDSTLALFKLVDGGTEAVRTRVVFGKASVKTIVVRGGLGEGDRLILSDMSQWDNVDRVRLR